ncbi:lysostaphin resistance A-like protein [Streptomyces sp. NPDC102451]|uniref:CPBP family intramembrane glutamic endopeptidase n=1 Tax=Streptomyces sp. NPDC102451 TaxID=3366177 RepID=UPI00381D9454
MLASLPTVALWVRERPLPLVLYVLVLLGVTGAAVRTRSAPTLRTVLVADLVLVLVLVSGVGIWPAPLGLAVLIAWLVWRRIPLLRSSPVWLRRGKLTRDLPWLVAATAVVSALALTVWALVADPAAGRYLESLQSRPVLLVLLGITAFSLVNAACEEAVYRGVFQTELTAVMGTVPALAVQAIGFGLLHIQGFPSGAAGVVLAGIYGVFLGIIRMRSEGMLAPYVAHVCADVTIGALSVVVLRP